MNIPILTITPEELDSGTGCIVQRSVTETYPLHTHVFYEMFYILKGSALHNINGKYQMLTSGSLVFIRPNDIHKYEALNYYDFELISLGFPVDEIRQAFEWMDISIEQVDEPELPLHIVLTGFEKVYVERSLYHILHKPVGIKRRQYFRSILPYIVYLLINKPDGAYENLTMPIWFSNLIQEMRKRENYVEGLPRLLQLSNYSQEYLIRTFKKHIKLTPTEFINANRMNYVIELLLERNYNIVDICYMTGFNNLSHFYSVFEKQYGCTPKEFMRQYALQ